MKNLGARTGFLITLGLVSLWLAPCQAQTQGSGTKSTTASAIFPNGEKGPAQTFTGTVWVQNLVATDSIYQLASGSVTFEPGARSFWHSHPSGQILLVTDGVGYHQLKGEPRQTIRKGDVVKCPPKIPHWHGASADSPMTHIHIVPNTEKGIVNWLQAVTDAEYNGVR
ncbi:cupin domain-containing protein [Spirosoma sp. KNUC1025]|uniref:(R)-mandelonitrile lyase n=1 Tax=Spirosoma sp. KNUC1025 TaxID=2894082 RepID=UPI0038661A1C|nr:cupin domain-containing protein [Spirosoma sp. KNUC1025]